MRMGFYAYDVGPANLLRTVAESAEKMGHQTIVLAPQVRGLSALRGKEMKECNIVAVGLSSFQTQEEIALIEQLLSFGVPAAVIEDVPGVALRPKAKDFASRISSVIAAMPFSEIEARDFGYKKTIYLGPPPHWGKSYREMEQAIKENLRLQLTAGCGRGSDNAKPISPGEVVLYCPGIKNPATVNKLLKIVIRAGRRVLDDHLIIAFRKHPGEKAEKEAEKPLFERLFEERKEILSEVRLIKNNDLSDAQLFASSDITIYTDGVTNSIVASYARIPTIFWYDADTSASLRTEGISSGKWFVAEYGGSLQVDSTAQMERAIKYLLSPEGKNFIFEQQEKNFPLPKTWDTVPQIVRYLETLAR